MATPLNLAPQIFYGGSWHTVPILAAAGPTQIDRGYTDEGTIKPSKLTMRINDSAAPSLNPSTPASVLYGVTGRALPVAFSAGSTVRAWLESANMEPDQDQGFIESPQRATRWLDIEAQGPLFRIQQWSDTSESPMLRTFRQFATLTGYWPGEDPRGTLTLSQLAGFSVSHTSSVTPGGDPMPAGSAGSFTTNATSNLILIPASSATAGFQVFWSTQLDAMPLAGEAQMIAWIAGSLRFSVTMDAGGIHVRAITFAGVTVFDSYVGYGSMVPTDAVAYRAKCYQSGGNVVCEFAWYTQDDTFVLGTTASGAGTLTRLSSIRVEGSTLIDGASWSHLGSLAGVADDLQSITVLQAVNAYRGETAGNRFLRLLDEAGIACSVMGDPDDTQPMGPQATDTLMSLLKECAASEDGLIFDKRDGIELVFRTRRDRYNQVAALALTYPADIVPKLKERLDNLGAQNLVTIENRAGGVATAARTTGAMSTANYPTGIGVWKGGAYPDVKVSVADPDTQLQTLADWYLARGTVPGPRFPTVVIEVGLRSPGLQTAAKAVEIGDRLTITGRLPEVIELIVIGISERIDNLTWEFTFTCVPGDVFLTGGEDSSTFLQDTYANTIITAPAPATTGTSMVVGSPDPDDVWSTTSLPYPVLVAGERMTVTAATAPALVSGTWRQTLTVTRSVNGVVKAQVAGTEVHVAAPLREAW